MSNFYRAMHFSANAQSWDRMSSVCPSVRPSVCNVGGLDCDHTDWKSWELIARTTPNTFALCIQKAIHLLPGEHGEILGKLEVG